MKANNLLIISAIVVILALIAGIVLISWQSAMLQNELSSIRADLANVTARCIK
jgi:hypothetical protein